MIDAETIQAYLNGELSPEAVDALAKWLLASPDNRALFLRESALATSLGEPSAPIAHPRTKHSSARVTASPSLRPPARGPSPRQRQRPRYSPGVLIASTLAVAAVAVVATVFVSVIFGQAAVSRSPTTSVTVAKTASDPVNVGGETLRIGEARGQISIVRNQVPLKTLPTHLLAGDQVLVGPQASLRLDMDRGQTRIWAEPDTTVTIATLRETVDRAGTTLALVQGKLLIEAAPQPANSPLRIRSVHSEAEVIGTVLSFDVRPNRDQLHVAHGSVAYRKLPDGQRTQVAAGEFGECDGARITVGPFSHQLPAAVTGATVSGFSLVDNKTGMPIPGFAHITSGSVVDFAKLNGRHLNIRATVAWPTPDEMGYIVFRYDDHRNHEATPPYSLFKEALALPTWVPPEKFANGIHVLSATPYSPKPKPDTPANSAPDDVLPDSSNKLSGHSATIIFTVINSTPQ